MSPMPTTLVLDDIIYRLQAFGGASDFWRELSDGLSHRSDLTIRRVDGSSAGRLLPVSTSSKEVLHSSHFRVPLHRNRPCITTIHDLNFERRLIAGRAAPVNLWQRRRSVRRANIVACISDFTRSELLDVYGDDVRAGVDVVTIHHGRSFGGPTSRTLGPSDVAPPGGFLLSVGTRAGYKNFDTAVRAFAQSGLAEAGVELWCTGPAASESDVELIRNSGLAATNVRFLGLIERERLAGLYEHAVGLIYPSRYEGFGLPPLDAMSLGCPVAGSASTSVQEIVSTGGILVDPDDVDGFAAAVRSMLEPHTRSALIAAGLRRAADFSWQAATDAYAKCYRQLGAHL